MESGHIPPLHETLLWLLILFLRIKSKFPNWLLPVFSVTLTQLQWLPFC